MATLVFVLLAYIIGSVPSGLIIGKVFYHTDLRDYGSKNIGATNAYRVLGAVPGLAVLASDMGKGLLGVYLGKTAGLAFGPDDPSCVVYFMIAGGLAALAGPFLFRFSVLQRRQGRGNGAGCTALSGTVGDGRRLCRLVRHRGTHAACLLRFRYGGCPCTRRHVAFRGARAAYCFRCGGGSFCRRQAQRKHTPSRAGKRT